MNLTSTAACGDYPEIDGAQVGPSVSVVAPGSYSIEATQFCGTSAFYSWISSGGVALFPDFAAFDNSDLLAVDGTGTVTANYLTEPAGEFPVILRETGLPSNETWTAMVGSWPGIANGTTIILGVPNGTYSVVPSPIPGFTASGFPHLLVVNGAGVLITVIFTHTNPNAGGPAWDSWIPLGAACLLFAAAGSVLALLIRVRSRQAQG
ncbi:MAG: hypothetical protein ACLP8Y_02205 [Thermoplasmata archaeon]